MKLCNKTKELIAIGASVTANCQPCLQYHVSKAVEFGADEQEVAEAVETGKAVRKGAAAKMDKFASDLCTAALSDAPAPAEGCGCS